MSATGNSTAGGESEREREKKANSPTNLRN